MTFCAECKQDIIENYRFEGCCNSAHLYGILSFCKSFSKERICIASEYDFVVNHVLCVLTEFGISKTMCELSKSKRDYQINIYDHNTIDRLLTDFGYSGDEYSFRINPDNFNCDSCKAAFLAGSFLSCGTVTSPELGYHLEFTSHKKNLFRDLFELTESAGFEPKTTSRSSSYVMYFKNSEQIEDVLTFLGAFDASLKLMDAKIYKDVKNKVNRRMNCDSANLDKAIEAAEADKLIIEQIYAKKGKGFLPDELRAVARLRLEQPELTLTELGEALPDKLSKSGVNHRLRKIRAIASELKEENA